MSISQPNNSNSNDRPISTSTWLSLWGLGALLLAALGVSIAVLAGVRWLSLVMVGAGLALAVTGAWKCRACRRTGVWSSTLTGGIVCVTILVLIVLFPGVLNSFWAMDSQPVESDPDLFVVVPRENPRDEGRSYSSDLWLDAEKEGLRQDDLFIHIEAAKVGHLPERGGPFLLVPFHLLQFQNNRPTTFERFDPGHTEPRLTDETGRSYRFVGDRVRKPPSKFDVLLKVDHLLVFELVAPGIQSLKLEVPAAAWGRTGTCRFHIAHLTHEEPPSDFSKLIAQTKSMLRKAPQTPPDPVLGRTLFVRNCQECHTFFGFGGKVGPDLTTSKRDDLDFLLTSIINPSAVIEKPYLPTLITTTSGIVYNGIVKQQDQNAVTLIVPNKQIVIPRDEIDTMRESKISLMPTDLLKSLNEHEVRSLIAYLTGKSQVPLLATADNAPYFFFYEQNLSNWKPVNSVWTAHEGELIAPSPQAGKPAVLVSQLHLASDFHMTIRFQPGAGGRGAIVLTDAAQPQRPSGPRIAFVAGSPLELVGFGTGNAPSLASTLVLEQWNKLEVTVEAKRIQVKLNDTQVATLPDDAAPVRRAVVLEGSPLASQETRFRNLDLRLLQSRQ